MLIFFKLKKIRVLRVISSSILASQPKSQLHPTICSLLIINFSRISLSITTHELSHTNRIEHNDDAIIQT